MRTSGWPRIAYHGGPFRPNSGKAPPPPPLSSAAAGRHSLAAVGYEIHGLDQTSGFLYENNSFSGIMYVLHSSPWNHSFCTRCSLCLSLVTRRPLESMVICRLALNLVLAVTFEP